VRFVHGSGALLSISFGFLLLWVAPGDAFGQGSEGSTRTTLAGAALGAYSGAALGLVGGLLPCDRAPRARRCAIVSTSVGGVLGLTMGALIGSRDEEALFDKAQTAGVGLLVGAAFGVLMRRSIRQYGWADALAVAAIGGAVGASPQGVAIGASTGAAVGALTWLVLPSNRFPDLIMLTLGGGALGGLIDWARGAVTAGDQGPFTSASFSITVR